jgi:pectate lyase
MFERIPGKTALVAACLLAAGITPAALAQAGVYQNPPADLATEVLPANDGWAASGAGTTGGAAALPANIFTVSNFAQLKAALNNASSTAKIIQISGMVNGAVNASNVPLSTAPPCPAFDVSPYTEAAYIASSTATTGPSSAQASAASKSETAYKPFVVLAVGSNTTIVGIGNNAVIKGINLTVSSPVTNVIIRNITFQDAIDCYPVWTPTDINSNNPFYRAANSSFPGNFNSNFDNVSILGAKNWWVDHCTFTDNPDTDDTEPLFFNRPYQWHDGELDITNASDLGTVSWTILSNHGKTDLIGGSDTASGDNGHLRTTFHHDMWLNAEERQPRVRFGEVDLYNNYYSINHPLGNGAYVYSWGAGVSSHIYAQNNAFINPNGLYTPNQILYDYGNLTQPQVCVIDARWNNPDATVDPVALANASIASWAPTDTVSSTGLTVAQTLAAAAKAGTTPLVPSCSFWTPTLRQAPPDATEDVPALVLSGAVAAPSVSAAPVFGNVTTGKNATQTVTLSNAAGAGILLLNTVTATGDFSVTSNNCITSLAAGSSCMVGVSFTPTAEGTRTGTLSFSDWAKSSPQTVNLVGSGVLAGNQQLVTTAVLTNTGNGYQAVVTVVNNGTGTAQNVTLTTAALGSAGGMALPASLGNIAHGGGSASVTLTFPSSAGNPGAAVVEKLTGTYSGGTFGGSFRATLPNSQQPL